MLGLLVSISQTGSSHRKSVTPSDSSSRNHENSQVGNQVDWFRAVPSRNKGLACGMFLIHNAAVLPVAVENSAAIFDNRSRPAESRFRSRLFPPHRPLRNCHQYNQGPARLTEWVCAHSQRFSAESRPELRLVFQSTHGMFWNVAAQLAPACLGRLHALCVLIPARCDPMIFASLSARSSHNVCRYTQELAVVAQEPQGDLTIAIFPGMQLPPQPSDRPHHLAATQPPAPIRNASGLVPRFGIL
jgi:hypothetical protein